jgi:hypothetical protein
MGSLHKHLLISREKRNYTIRKMLIHLAAFAALAALAAFK